MSLVQIHQIFFREDQRSLLDPAFVPYDNTANTNAAWREYHVFRKEYFSGRLFEKAKYVGFMSWKFGHKTGIRGADFQRFIEDNPDHDVYFINPFWAEATLFSSLWELGEQFHPGLRKITQSILRHTTFDLDLNSPHAPGTRGYCNYWVGNEKFWKAFISVCEELKDVIETKLNDEERRLLFSRADRRIDANYIPFIFERIFTSLLNTNHDLKFLEFRYTEAQLRRRHGAVYNSIRLVEKYEGKLPEEDLEALRALARFQFRFQSTVDVLSSGYWGKFLKLQILATRWFKGLISRAKG